MFATSKINKFRIKKGFTLIELLVAISIIGVLTSVAMLSFNSAQKKARDSQRKQDLDAIQKALELAKQDTTGQFYYPSCVSYSSGACALSDSSTSPALATTYMKAAPTDPKTSAGYKYTPTPTSCGSNACTAYTLLACLENKIDQERVAADGSSSPLDPCGGTTADGLVGYQVTNL